MPAKPYTATHVDVGGPFHDAVVGGVSEEDMIRLALIFRVAHTSSDVWAGCRVDRAFRRWCETGLPRSLSEYLSGKYFAALLCDGEDFIDLEAMRGWAEDFLAPREV